MWRANFLLVALLFPLLDPPPPHLHVDTHAHTQSKRERASVLFTRLPYPVDPSYPIFRGAN